MNISSKVIPIDSSGNRRLFPKKLHHPVRLPGFSIVAGQCLLPAGIVVADAGPLDGDKDATRLKITR